MDKLEEMDKFLEKYNLSKLNQKKIETLSSPITSIEIKTVIKSLPRYLIIFAAMVNEIDPLTSLIFHC